MISWVLVGKFQVSEVHRRTSKGRNNHSSEYTGPLLPVWQFLVLELTLQEPDREEVICSFLINQSTMHLGNVY